MEYSRRAFLSTILGASVVPVMSEAYVTCSNVTMDEQYQSRQTYIVKLVNRSPLGDSESIGWLLIVLKT